MDQPVQVCVVCGKPRAADAPLPLCARCVVALIEQEEPSIDWAAVCEQGWE